MARRRIPVPVVAFEVPVDERPVGAVLFADPSKAEFARHVHTHNWPETHQGNQFRQDGVQSITGTMVPYGSRQFVAERPWDAMNRKRGVTDCDTEEG